MSISNLYSTYYGLNSYIKLIIWLVAILFLLWYFFKSYYMVETKKIKVISNILLGVASIGLIVIYVWFFVYTVIKKDINQYLIYKEKRVDQYFEYTEHTHFWNYDDQKIAFKVNGNRYEISSEEIINEMDFSSKKHPTGTVEMIATIPTISKKTPKYAKEAVEDSLKENIKLTKVTYK